MRYLIQSDAISLLDFKVETITANSVCDFILVDDTSLTFKNEQLEPLVNMLDMLAVPYQVVVNIPGIKSFSSVLMISQADRLISFSDYYDKFSGKTLTVKKLDSMLHKNTVDTDGDLSTSEQDELS